MRSSRLPFLALVAASAALGCSSAPDEGRAPAIGEEPVGTVRAALTNATTWSQGGASPQRAGVNGYDAAINAANVSALSTAWQTSADHPTNAAIAFGRAYTGSVAGVVRSVDMATGATVWAKTIPYPIYMSPAVAYGRVYFTAGKFLFALASSSSSLLFRIKHTYDVGFSAPLVLDDKVYVRDAVGKIFVYSAHASGTSVAALHNFNVSASADPSSGDGRVYVPSTDGKVYAFSSAGCAGTCAPVWSSANLGGTIWTPAALWPPRVFVTVTHESGASVHALDSSTGATLWSRSLGSAAFAAGPVVGYDKVHVAVTSPAEVWSVSQSTGAVVWKGALADDPTDTPSLANELLYVPSGRTTGKIEVFDTRCATGGGSCTPTTTLTTEPYGYSPSLAGGQLVFSGATKTVSYTP
ncbi:MAG: PQQ-binding-like beta-propeller repeat protein [Deltaproteobacteria bacterium]|nr:PQQ-binding-like beta-propeller repeat protein [Deltaproteobacteria bacterium]